MKARSVLSVLLLCAAMTDCIIPAAAGYPSAGATGSPLALAASREASSAASDDDDPLKPLRTDSPPIIDGRLDDAVWQKAPFVTGFKTWSPDYGRDMSQKTVAYMAYDGENLYFAIRCYDTEPDKVKTSISRRDNIRSDDWIAINLDSFNDKQSLYAFYINPQGIQQDSRLSAGREDMGVDLVWYSAGTVDEEGYAVEVQIPFKSIRFANKNPVEMGVIFERSINRLSEGGTYPELKPGPGVTMFLTYMKPMVLYDVKHYTLFEVLPAVTYGERRVQDQGELRLGDRQEDLSLTTKLGITSDLILDGTINPDFSQVEADAAQVDENLRFPLFFAEKRPFFLEGRESFNFAGSSGSDPLSSIVHTRRIVDPEVGIKLAGKLSRDYTIASIYAYDNIQSQGVSDDRAHFAIARFKRRLNEDSYLGAVVTAREREHGHNRVIGADGILRVNSASILGYHLLSSHHKPDGQSNNISGHAFGMDYQYRIRKWRVSAGLHDLSDDFTTETGFVRRIGITKLRASVSPRFYPFGKVIRTIDPSISTTQTHDKPSDLWETDNTLSLGFGFQRNGRLSISYNHATEVFLNQRFDAHGWSVSGRSQWTKEVFLSVSYSNGKAIRYVDDPFQAKGQRLSGSMTLQASDKLSGNFSVTYSDLLRDDNSEKIFDTTILRSRIIYQMNQYLFFRSIVEVNSLRETLESDLLASFTYIPGTVMHFGFGSLYEKIRWQNDDYVASDRYLETKRGFFAKASYLWRL